MTLDQQQQKPEVVESTTTTKTSDGLLRAITGDIVAGLVSATCVAPAVTIIDRVIIEKTARRYCVIPGLRTYIHSAFKNPRLFILGQPFRYVWALYAPTFAAANVAETLATPISDSAAKMAAVLGVLTINVPLGIWKDIKFSQLYGFPLTGNSTAVSSAASKMRMKGTSVFLVRDAVTVFSSFAVAPWFAPRIPDTVARDLRSKAVVSHFTVPVLAQSLSTPLHLLGLDYMGVRDSSSLLARIRRTRRDWPTAMTIRSIRILPTFGLGCIMNSELRSSIKERLA